MAAAALLCCGCVEDNVFSDDPEQEQEEEQPQGVKIYTISEYQTFKTEVGELSSICFNAKADGFYAVGDEGTVYEIGTDGKTRSLLYDKGNHDWEGVELYGNSILLIDESESTLYSLDGGTLKKISVIEIPDGGASGKGPEGIMCVGDELYVGNQASPTRIVRFNLKEKASKGWFDITFVKKNISDLFYDKADNTMWLVDSKGPAFHHSTLDGKLIATYKIPFVDQAEAIAIDHKNGVAWIGCDTSSNLYKMNIKL